MVAELDLPRIDRPAPDSPQYLTLRDRIAAGPLSAGTRLPPERQLQTDTGAARGTIREALFQLEAEGLIYRRDRSGWYTSQLPVIYEPMRWAGFMSYVVKQHRTPATRTLATETIPASAAVAEVYGMAADTPVFAIDRRRSIDGRPVLIERIIVDPAMAPGLFDHSLDGSLTQILTRHYGLSVARNRVDMQPWALTPFAAEALGVKPGTPGLLVVRTSLSADGRVVEYDHEYWRHDAIRIHVELDVYNDRGTRTDRGQKAAR